MTTQTPDTAGLPGLSAPPARRLARRVPGPRGPGRPRPPRAFRRTRRRSRLGVVLVVVTALAGMGVAAEEATEPDSVRSVTARGLPAAGTADPRFAAAAATPRPGFRGAADAPVLVLTDPAVPYGDAICRGVLATEGLPACAATDAGALPAGFDLSPYRVVIAADGHPLPASLVSDLTRWVGRGGHLIALRPADNLTGLLGLRPRTALLDDAYLAIDPASAEGAGLARQTLRYHGEADEHPLAGAQVVARLYSSTGTATAFPAVTTRAVGQGTADAWAFDPARSVLRSRNGDPALAGKETVSTDDNVRLADRFGGGYLDLDRAGVPQADQLMHLLTHQIVTAAPVPRLWYLPSYEPASHPGGLLKAAVVLTGDDHDTGHSRTLARFAAERAVSPAGCSPAEWTCVTSTSYAYANSFADSAATAYANLGFEVAPHISEAQNCVSSRTSAGIDAVVRNDLATWYASFPALAATHPPLTERAHCYGDWTSDGGLTTAESRAGITTDLSPVCWPEKAFAVPQCLLTGSALPMDYADGAGRLRGVTELTTVATDENPASSSRAALGRLISSAVDGHGYYGYLAMLAHLDGRPESDRMADDVVDLAKAYGVPVISARQAATFWAGRAATRMEHVRSTPGRLAFDLADPVHNLELMIPVQDGVRRLTSVSLGGADVRFTTQTLDGVTYALLPSAAAGHYVARYA